MEQQEEALFNKVYLTPENPGSFSGISALLNETNKLLLHSKSPKVSRKTVVHYLKSKDAYTLHKEARRQFVRNPIKIGPVYDYAQADLMSFIDLAKYNKGTKYVLTVIDTRSRFLWFKFQKSKTAQETAQKFQQILRDIKPHKFALVSTDQGKEFALFPSLLKTLGIRYFTQLSGEIKTAILDRTHRTIQNKLARAHTHFKSRDILKLLPKIIRSYNNTMHRSLNGKTPAQVLKLKLGSVKLKPVLQGKEKRKFKIGEHVRILDVKKDMVHGYRPHYSDEIFLVDRVREKTGFRTMYYLKSLSGEPILGGMYAEELQSVVYTPSEYTTIEKIVRKKRIKGKLHYLVKWQGFPKSDNSWIPATNVVEQQAK
jgi:chromodomain-containing protein